MYTIKFTTKFLVNYTVSRDIVSKNYEATDLYLYKYLTLIEIFESKDNVQKI